MQEKAPTVTVIIPSYNCERYIAETLDSILGQSYKNIEVIVVDDGSSDQTREIIKSYGAPVRLVVQNNAGVCAARNRGIRESVGKYICFIDHDDCWFPDKLIQQLQQFEREPEAGVVYSAFINWSAGADGKFPNPRTFNLDAYAGGVDDELSGWIRHKFLLDCWMLTSTAMFNAEVFRLCGVFDESLPYSEDWELWLRIAKQYTFFHLKKPTTLYRQHGNQGNRTVRERDYRTELLVREFKKWGLMSRDGRCITRRQFFDQLAVYYASFGFSHLVGGKFSIAFRSFIKAWRCSPLNFKYLAYIPASLMGWKPKSHS